MGLLDSILGAASGKSDASGGAAPLIGVLGGLLGRAGDCRAWLTNFHRAARVMHSRHGLAWAKTSRFPAIKSKTCLVPTKSAHSPQRWEWILPKPRIFWPNTC